MKNLTSVILAVIFTITIALAVINTTFSTQNNDSIQRYASIIVDVPDCGHGVSGGCAECRGGGD